MKNQEVAAILNELADLLEILNVQWKPNAFRKAARTVDTLSEDIEDVYKRGGLKALMELPGVGEGISKTIEEFLKSGKVKELKKLEKKVPKGVDKMMHLMGLGPKKAFKLYKELKIHGLGDLERAAKEGLIRKVEGFGAKSESEILSALGMHLMGKKRHRLRTGLDTARELESRLRKLKEVKRAEAGGSVRRRKETIADVDILVSSTKPKKVMDFFTKMPDVKKVLAKGMTKSMVLLDSGLQADVRVLDEKSYGAALQYFTGNKDHNVKLRNIAIKKGLKLSEYGVFTRKGNRYVAGRTEADVYRKLGMAYIEPELRENSGEIEAAMKGKLPKLIGYKDIKGDLHMHTKWSDGANTTEEMIRAAMKLGRQYIAITDHSKAEIIANGLTEARVTKHLAEIEKIQRKFPRIKILKGTECDILKDGKLDYPKSTLDKFDVIIGSVHRSFKMSKADQTKRYLKAIESGYLTAIGHPTGRRINERPAFEFDIEKVSRAAEKAGVAMEINGQPGRLDLKDVHIRVAKETGVKFMINSDSHTTDNMRFMELGIAQARRGWLEKKDVLNTLPKAKFLKAIR